ncbi:Uncharacterised protein, partial [Mycoplasma putrefaciens]
MKNNDYKLNVSYDNDLFNLDIGKVNDSTRPIILKVLKSDSNPSSNGKIFSISNW